MKFITPTVKPSQIFLAIVLLLLGNLASSLHTHDISQTSLDTSECKICLVGNAGADATPFTPSLINQVICSNTFIPTIKDIAKKPVIHNHYNTRAPPFFS